MKAPSLQTRLALVTGLLVTVFWLVAALVTADRLSARMNEVFDADLRATAQRILPLAIHNLKDRRDDDEREDHEIGHLHDGDEPLSYLVRDASGAVLLRSQGSVPGDFPAFAGTGFRDVGDMRLFEDQGADGQVTISVAEPLGHRNALALAMMLNLSLPLLVLIPLSLLAIAFALRRGFRPLRQLEASLAGRGAQDLSPLADASLPRELQPFAAEVNQLLARLRAAFEAERSFAANAAHELRTPVAGAIAQAQRLKAETADPQAARRAVEIETTLKRLMRTSEKLMQLARAEGGRMRLERPADVRTVVRIVADDFIRQGAERCQLTLPDQPVPSLIEPDALGILCRNLIENALRHGDKDGLVRVALSADGVLTVTNGGPTLDAATLDRLTQRFQRGDGDTEGAGLGLAIVKAVADRSGAGLTFHSPVPGELSGLQVRVALPRD